MVTSLEITTERGTIGINASSVGNRQEDLTSPEYFDLQDIDDPNDLYFTMEEIGESDEFKKFMESDGNKTIKEFYEKFLTDEFTKYFRHSNGREPNKYEIQDYLGKNLESYQKRNNFAKEAYKEKEQKKLDVDEEDLDLDDKELRNERKRYSDDYTPQRYGKDPVEKFNVNQILTLPDEELYEELINPIDGTTDTRFKGYVEDLVDDEVEKEIERRGSSMTEKEKEILKETYIKNTMEEFTRLRQDLTNQIYKEQTGEDVTYDF